MFVAEVVALILGAFVGVVGSFNAASDLLVFVTAVKVLSFLSSTSKNSLVYRFLNANYNMDLTNVM